MAQVIFPAVVVPGSTADPAEPSSPSDGQIWVDTDGTAPTTVVTRWSKAPTAGTTTLTGTDDGTTVLAYTPGYEEVFLNGVLLSRVNDYTASTGTSVVLSAATVAGDIAEVICPLQVAYTDTITTAAAASTYVPKTLTTTTGDIIYASAANTPARLGIGSTDQVLKVSGGVPTWATPATTGFIGCSVTKSAVQSIANATATTLTWDGELFDTSTFHDDVTNNSRITIPTGKDGKYQVTAFASPTGNATGVREITVCKNAGLTSLFDSTLAAVSASSIGFGVSGICSLVAGDYLQVQVYQSSGGSLNYNYQSFITYFSVTYLGA